MAGRRIGAALAAVLVLAGPSAAQQAAAPPSPSPAPAQPPSPPAAADFLLLNQERILTGSQAGQRLLADEERQRDELRSAARALDQSFEKEESELTARRPTLAPEEFRKLSDAFDTRVVQARRDQDSRANELAQEFDQRRRQFYGQVAPILVMLMDRYGAKAIFDETSVLLADQSLNVTDAVIAEIDARMPATDATPPAPAPGAGPAPAPPAAGIDGGN